jgi:hypothetical protein
MGEIQQTNKYRRIKLTTRYTNEFKHLAVLDSETEQPIAGVIACNLHADAYSGTMIEILLTGDMVDINEIIPDVVDVLVHNQSFSFKDIVRLFVAWVRNKVWPAKSQS